jgi:hypothetical protein
MSNLVDKIIAYESGDMTGAEMVYLFSELVRSGQAWSLQGHYGRMAHRLIELGILMPDGDIDEMTAIENGIEM